METATSRLQAKQVGLVLSGGGARGAYQAGVMKALAEIMGQTPDPSPISILTGVSAGAINATYLASGWDDPLSVTRELARMWSELHAEQVFKTDAISLGRIGLRWLTDATFGALYSKKRARALLDTSPLKRLLSESIPFEKIQKNLAEGHLRALSISAMNYNHATSISFVQAERDVPMWDRARRRSERATLTAEHVLGSASIPIFFPPVQVGDEHYGDGCVRNTAPLSPAIHLGADKLIVVSVRRPDTKAPVKEPNYDPTIARVLGVVLNALFLDAIDMDMERMSRINATLDYVPETVRAQMALRKVDFLWIRPSQDIGMMAADKFGHLPTSIRYLMGGLGSSQEASELTSYLLFDPDFCGQLVELGYRDGLAQQDEIIRFLSGANAGASATRIAR